MPNATAAELRDRYCAMLDLVAADPDGALAALATLYIADMRFQDPVSRISSRDEFLAMNRRFLESAKDLEFTVLDRSASDHGFFVAWHMRYVPAGMFTPGIDCEGATWCSVQAGRITDHRDYWDLASGLADAVPTLGKLYRGLVERLV